MNAKTIEHPGLVKHVAAGLATVAIQSSGCGSCAQGSACGIGKLAADRPDMLLRLPCPSGIKAGDPVLLQIQSSRLSASAVIGYLFPAAALLLGAGIGAAISGSDAGTALGAIAGFLGALGMARAGIKYLPELLPIPRLLPISDSTDLSTHA